MNTPTPRTAEGTYQLSCLTAERQYKMATFWQHKGLIDRAIALYQQAIAQQPNYIPGYLGLAPLLYQQQRYDESIALYRQAITLGATEPWIIHHIEDSLIGKGEFANFDRQLNSSVDSPLNTALKGISGALASDSVEHKRQQDKRQQDNRKHILLYTNCPGTYGAERISHLLMCHLAAQNYRVTCVQSKAKHELIEARDAAGIEHIWLEGDAHQFLYSVTNVLEVVQIFKRARPDVVVFADGEPMANIGASQAAMRLSIPFVKVVHCVNVDWAEKFSAYLHLLPPIYDAAAAVIAVSQANLQLMRDRYYLPQSIGQVIYNGCADRYFQPRDLATKKRIRRALNIPDSAVVVFTAARLVRSKGHQHQLAAMERLQQTPQWGSLYFLWAGSGCEDATLKAEAEAMGVADYVRFLGDRSDVSDLLEASDIFVLSSHFEGMPLSIIEAMAKGCAVAATNISGIPEALGRTGKLLSDPTIDPAQTAKELAEIVEQWAENCALRKAAAEACRQRALQLFQPEAMTNAYHKLIENILIQD